MTGDERFDVVVVGAGVSGIAAACGAAASGATVLVLERYGVLGGVASTTGVGTICGAFLRSSDRIAWGCTTFARRFVETHLLANGARPVRGRDGIIFVPYEIPSFHRACHRELSRCGIVPRLHATVTAVESDSRGGARIEYLEWNSRRGARCGALVDASGEALVSSLLGLPLEAEGERQAPSLSLGISGLPPEEDDRSLNLALAKLFAPAGASTHGRLSILPGSKSGSNALVKYAHPHCLALSGSHAHGVAELEAREQALSLFERLRAELPQFRGAALTWISSQAGFRTGARPESRTPLTEAMVCSCAKPEDGVAIAPWPIEQWGEAGRVNLQTFAENDHYLVPAGALESRHLDALFFCGRGMGGDERALASARVIGTALGTGFAAGSLAAGRARGESRSRIIEQLRREECRGVGETWGAG